MKVLSKFVAVASCAIVLLVSSLFAGGCGPVRRALVPPPNPAEVGPAVIRSRTMLRREGGDSISIKSIDGMNPTLLEYKWVVPPGEHRLEVELEFYEDSGAVKDRTYVTKVKRNVEMYAAPNQNYILDARKVGENVYVWLSERDSGRVVAGESPHGNTLPGFDRNLNQ